MYDLPMVGRDEKVLRQIRSRFEEVLEIDYNTSDGIRKSVRMKVLLQLEKPLKRGMKIWIRTLELCWIPIIYERLSSFYYYVENWATLIRIATILLNMKMRRGP